MLGGGGGLVAFYPPSRLLQRQHPAPCPALRCRPALRVGGHQLPTPLDLGLPMPLGLGPCVLAPGARRYPAVGGARFRNPRPWRATNSRAFPPLPPPCTPEPRTWRCSLGAQGVDDVPPCLVGPACRERGGPAATRRSPRGVPLFMLHAFQCAPKHCPCIGGTRFPPLHLWSF